MKRRSGGGPVGTVAAEAHCGWGLLRPARVVAGPVAVRAVGRGVVTVNSSNWFGPHRWIIAGRHNRLAQSAPTDLRFSLFCSVFFSLLFYLIYIFSPFLFLSFFFPFSFLIWGRGFVISPSSILSILKFQFNRNIGNWNCNRLISHLTWFVSSFFSFFLMARTFNNLLFRFCLPWCENLEWKLQAKEPFFWKKACLPLIMVSHLILIFRFEFPFLNHSWLDMWIKMKLRSRPGLNESCLRRFRINPVKWCEIIPIIPRNLEDSDRNPNNSDGWIRTSFKESLEEDQRFPKHPPQGLQETMKHFIAHNPAKIRFVSDSKRWIQHHRHQYLRHLPDTTFKNPKESRTKK